MAPVAALLLVFAGVVGQQSQSVPPYVDLPLKVLALTGNSPRECGRFRLRQVGTRFESATPKELEAAVRCARQAVRDGRPFWTFNERHGIDSWVAHGLLRTADGALHYFVYDGSPCGGPQCEPTLSLEPCREPAVMPAADGMAVDFTCRR
jgi:hypothetical protein